jgi:antitoxin component HigA of HigAB toxin-antitoxin module
MKAINQIKLRLLDLKIKVELFRDKTLCFINPIRTSADYRRALWQVCAIHSTDPAVFSAKERDRFNRLIMRINNYEQEKNFWGKQ